MFCNLEFSHDRNEYLTHVGENYLRQLMPAAKWALIKQNKQVLQGLIDDSAVNQDIQALAFYDASGQLLVYRGERPAYSLHRIQTSTTTSHIDPYNVDIVTPIRISPFNLYAPSNHTPNLLLSPNQPDMLIGWVVMRIDTTSAWVKHYKMMLITVLISFFAMIIGFIMHHYLSKNISAPLYYLHNTMKQILNNDALDIPIVATNRGEIGIIESGLAHMQQKYRDTVHELNYNIDMATQDLQQSHELLEEKNIQLLLDKRESEERYKQKSAFITNLSHEIRTPINGIIGFANLLLESQLGPLEHEYAKTIKSSGHDLLSIINDILDYSKIDACKLQLDILPLDIRTCIDDVFALSIPNAHKKGLDLIPSTANHVPQTVLGDPLRIKQILSNLIDNAIKFTDKGYVILRTTVDQETDKDYTLCFSVSDTGIGITTDDQATLFQPFQQADSTITRRYGGSGLGLVISQHLAQHMSGRLTLTSKPHHGTTLSAYLKLEKLPAYEIEKNQSRRFSQLTALCYDENPLYLEALCNGLGYLGLNCVAVSTFTQLKPALIKHPNAQLAFISVNTDHEELLSEILTKHPIPCILLSKWFISNYLELGASSFLFKPPNIQRLQEAITLIITPKKNLMPKATNTKPNLALDELRQQLRERRPSLLIADDNPTNRMLFYSWLSMLTSLSLVEDGAQAVLLCDKKRFDVILLDLHMPNLNGLLATQTIRTQSKLNQRTPIFLITANNQECQPLDLQNNAIDYRLTKPIEEKLLLEHLIRVITQKESKTIDWSLCVQKMSGNEAIAREFLIQFIVDLKQTRLELLSLNQAHEWNTIADAAHKLHGACCFFGSPILQYWVAKLERDALNDPSQRVDTFLQSIEHIDAVIKESLELHEPTHT